VSYSAAQVVHQYLLDNGLADESGGTWPIWVSFLPDEPNVALAIYDTPGTSDGRIMQGSKIIHPGIQITIRTPIYPDGVTKAFAIAEALDNQIKSVVAVESDLSYILHNVSRQGDINALGIDPDDRQRRHYWTINAVVTYAQQS